MSIRKAPRFARLWGSYLAKASEQFRQSDVTTWGIVALVCGALAVFGANIGALLPNSVMAGMHKARLEAASIDQLRQQVTSLREDTARLQRDNQQLLARFSLQEQAGTEMVRRVGALEVSVPRLIEALPTNAQIDRNALTASTGTDNAQSFDADGGSVVVRHSALPGPASSQDVQPLPAPLETAATPANVSPYGIAIGTPIPLGQATAEWTELTVKLGPLLFGLNPLVVRQGGDQQRIVVGPIEQLSEATALCQRLERISISCLPMPYVGDPIGPQS